MRALPIAYAILALTVGTVRGEDMISVVSQGLMCRDEKTLADFTAPDGSLKNGVRADFSSTVGKRYLSLCKDVGPGMTVHVVTKRINTSIVTYNGQTWFVPNIDFMTPTPDCIQEGSRVTFIGKLETAFNRTDEDDPKKGLHYPRLTLDRPVCYIGNLPAKDGRFVSLVGNSSDAARRLMAMAGKRVTVSGEVGSPDNGNQPPDPMMIFDPVVKPAP